MAVNRNIDGDWGSLASPRLSDSYSSDDLDYVAGDGMPALTAFERKWNRKLPRAWPGLVGDVHSRAAAIVSFASPYEVVTMPYKQTRSRCRPYAGPWNPLRVILFLDESGCVALTPRIG